VTDSAAKTKPAAIEATSLPPVSSTGYPEPYRQMVAGRSRRRLGDAFGLKNFGVNLTRLEPGAMSSMRHWHTRQDEFVYMLEGEAVLITDAGEQVMRPGMVAGFPAGKPDGHHMVNRSDKPAVYLEIGDRLPGDGADYDGMAPADQALVTTVAVNATKAIAAYLRQLRCGSGRFDRWLDGDATALSRAEQRGAALFVGRGGCVSCHGGAAAAAGLRLDLPRDPAKVNTNADDSTYFRLALDWSQQNVPANLRYTSAAHASYLDKPNLSKYVRMMNARGSLLYWKAANRRTDGHADADRSDDVDFGADHPTTITADELGTLSRWIDTGAGWGSDFTADGVDPVLHLTAVVSDGAITALRIGTTDVGSGVDVGSLTACIVPSGGATCGPNLAGAADPAGVVTIALASALGDPDAEVWASIKDLAGHLTEVHRTVRYLLNLPTPSVEAPDGGVADGGSDMGPPTPEPTLPGHGCGCAIGARAPAALGLGALGVLLALGLLAALARHARRQ